MNHFGKTLLIASFWVFSGCNPADHTVNDVTRLNPVKAARIVQPTTEDEIVKALDFARVNKLHVSIGGARHSQGRQTAYPGALILDMTGFKKILHIDEKQEIIRVQAGATWKDVQNAISPLGLSPRVQQASNIFTVGGSLSVNIHGWDPRFHEFIETVESFRLIDANGRQLEVSRKNNSELFRSVIGGYGLFGVVTEVTLKLCHNHSLKKQVVELPLEDYPDYFKKHVSNHPAVELHYARPDISTGNLFKTLLVSTFTKQDSTKLKEEHLPDEKNIFRNFWVFQMSRYLRIPGWFDLGKKIRWWLQKNVVDVPGKSVTVSRNRAMRPEIQFALLRSGFFHTDILQEYFVPESELRPFVQGMRGIILKHHVNLLSATLRPIRQDTESVLPYAQFDGFAIVLYVNLLTTPGSFFSSRWGEARARVWTQELIDLVIKHRGTFYLPYQRYARKDQVHRVYPQFQTLTTLKKKYDQGELFFNQFYETYR